MLKIANIFYKQNPSQKQCQECKFYYYSASYMKMPQYILLNIHVMEN